MTTQVTGQEHWTTKKTPDGDVPIEIPAGTHPSQRFRLRKRGMPHFGDPGSRGDLLGLLVQADGGLLVMGGAAGEQGDHGEGGDQSLHGAIA